MMKYFGHHMEMVKFSSQYSILEKSCHVIVSLKNNLRSLNEMCASFSIVVDAFSWPYYYTFGLVLLLLLVMVLGRYVNMNFGYLHEILA